MAEFNHPQRPFVWGIVGTGNIASLFAADLLLLKGTRIGAVCSRFLEKAQSFAHRFGADRGYADFDAFLADETLDAVYIATPNHLHFVQALTAIKARKPVLVEKPLALCSADALTILDASRRYGVFAMEGMWTRFLPAVLAARRHILEGRFGNLRRICAELSYARPQDSGRFFDANGGGGAALDLGVYAVSLTLQILGVPERIESRHIASSTGVDMRSEFRLHYPTALAELSCGFDRNGRNRYLIEGTGGVLILESPFLKAKRLTHYTMSAFSSPLFGPSDGTQIFAKLLDRLPLPGRRREHYGFLGNGLHFEAQAAMSAIRAGAIESDIMPLSESAAVLQVLDVAREGLSPIE